MSSDKAILEGGPEELDGRVVELETAEADLKISFGNGREHFRATSRRMETPQGVLPVYEWWERTEMPG